MTQDTIQIIMMLFLALLAVLLNINGWQIAYHLSKAIQLSVSTETETDTVYKEKFHKLDNISLKLSVFCMTPSKTQTIMLKYSQVFFSLSQLLLLSTIL